MRQAASAAQHRAGPAVIARRQRPVSRPLGGTVHMWTARSENLADGRRLKIAVDLDAVPVSYAEVLRRWQDDADFRSFFISLLADAPFAAFRWETPPIT